MLAVRPAVDLPKTFEYASSSENERTTDTDRDRDSKCYTGYPLERQPETCKRGQLLPG
jgi:hypothetical protein